MFEAARSAGKTDADGAYHFDLQLPAYFAGRPLSQGAARVLIEATVNGRANTLNRLSASGLAKSAPGNAGAVRGTRSGWCRIVPFGREAASGLSA